MIFSNNSTALGAGSIPMAEGYDCSFGPALALVEGARNDYAMFRAMLNVESRELQIRNESAGYVTEGEIAALAEAAGAGIWTKIKELFSKLVAKIKAIFHNFMAKLNSLTKSDKEMVKKYEKEILRKTNIGNLEVKWRKVKTSPIEYISTDEVKGFESLEKEAANWKEEADERFKFYAGVDPSEFEQENMDTYFDDEETLQVKEINGGIRGICSYLSAFDKKMSNVTKFVNKITSKLTKLVNEANKAADQKAKDKASDDEIKTANHVYDMAVAYQDVTLKDCSVTMDAIKIEYKQNKAAFMKAIAANDKKLEESAVLLNAIAEEAEQEVEDVISGSIDDVDLTNTNNASTNVLDPGVSSDPDALVYADDPDYTEADTAGTVDTNVNSREESAFFGKMLY
jgi:hypothetical protein